MSISQFDPVVLVVEDQGLLRMTAVSIMEDSGFEAVEAKNADEALTMLRHYPDILVVFMDIDLNAEKDGFWLAEQIKIGWPKIDVIVTSAYPRVRTSVTGSSQSSGFTHAPLSTQLRFQVWSDRRTSGTATFV